MDTLIAAAEPAPKIWTLEEYAEMEARTPERNIFYQGKIIPMAYTSQNHGLIVVNVGSELHSLAKKTNWWVFSSDRRVFVPECDLSFYPDVQLLFGEPQLRQMTKNTNATMNPTVIIEVLSNSTETYDQINKWKCYRTIPSLRQYIMISQKEPYIDFLTRIDDTTRWENDYRDRLDQSIRIGDFDLPLSEIYARVDFNNPN